MAGKNRFRVQMSSYVSHKVSVRIYPCDGRPYRLYFIMENDEKTRNLLKIPEFCKYVYENFKENAVLTDTEAMIKEA